jgi:hypothetical protein
MNSEDRRDEVEQDADGDQESVPGESAGDSSTGDGGEGEFTSPEASSVNRGSLALFGMLALAIGGTYFMYVRVGPKPAAAATADAQAAHKTIDSFLNGGTGNIKAMQTMLHDTEKVVQQFAAYPSNNQVPLKDLQTNPFRLADAEPAKSNVDMDADAAKRKHEQQRQEAVKALQGLQLQSVMCGETRRSCMIGGKFYAEGQGVDGFIIEKILQKSIVVKNSNGFRFELKMPAPAAH